MLRNVSLACAAMMTIAACSDQPHALEPITVPRDAQGDAVQFWENSAPAYWNAVARQLVATSGLNALAAIRGYSIVSVAQYNAAIAAENGQELGTHPSPHAAWRPSRVT